MTSYKECESRDTCNDVREELAQAQDEIERLRAALGYVRDTADLDGIPQLVEFCNKALGGQSEEK